MSILETIYESYIAGELNIDPKSMSEDFRMNLLYLEKKFRITYGEVNDFEDELLDVFAEIEKKSFYAGFTAAARLNAEISGKK